MYTENYFSTDDNLQLFYRDYHAADAKGLPLLCLHGLTRNSADFADFADVFAADHRLIVPDMRGRGRSDYDSHWQNYTIDTYVKDVWRLLDELDIETFVLVGMSMGGLMSMVMVNQQPKRIAGVVLNDIGPELAQPGIERIMGYMEVEQNSFSLQEAVARIKAVNEEFFPKFDEDDWIAFARRIYKAVGEDQYQTSYDKGITRAIVEGAAVAGDLWPAFAKLANCPSLVVRGGLSDLLDQEIVDKMLAVVPSLSVLEVPDMGHHPFLNEPECVSAIQQLLARINT